MLINEVIDKVKKFYKGTDENGLLIDPKTTRDKILFGDPEIECSGIVVTCWASIDVIKEAIDLGANLIISHEALFWNHGDETKWLENEGNQSYFEKKKLLEDNSIVVWRNHDYIHSGLPLGDKVYTDGIFYGVMKKVGWEKYLKNDSTDPLNFIIPLTSVKDVAEEWVKKLDVNGAKVIGNLETEVSNVKVAFHILGGNNDLINQINSEEIDLIIALEVVDFTVVEYIHDSNLLGHNKALFTIGHFNMEEPGMEYMTEYLPEIIGNAIAVNYVKSGDMYSYVIK